MRTSKKSVKKTFISILLLLAAKVCTNAKENIFLEHNSGNLQIMTLQNGLTLFVKEDTSSALVYAEFVCRAGYSSQSANNAGFFPLYADLFSATLTENTNELLRTFKVESSCNSDSTNFSCSINPENLEAFFESISLCARNPNFSDKEIKKAYEKLKEETESYAATGASFINGTIDSKIFSDAPWKHESGIYPQLFSYYSEAQVRTILYDIGKRWYTPDNCAIFLTGNTSHEDAYNLAVKYFSSWNTYFSGDEKIFSTAIHGQDEADEGSDSEKEIASAGTPGTRTEEKKFVLVDDYFSKDLSQVVVQYTSLPMSQADILSSAFNSYYSPYAQKELADEKLGIRSREYLSCASSYESSTTRLIFQALLEAPYSFSAYPLPADPSAVSPAEQCDAFAANIKAASDLTDEDFYLALQNIESKYKLQSGNSIQSMKLLANFWAIDSGLGENNFYEKFLNLVHDVQSQEKLKIHENILNEAPYIFLLVNTGTYEKYKDSFGERNYVPVTASDSSWYHNYLSQRTQSSAEKLSGEDIPSEEQFSSAEKFLLENKNTFFTGNLSNGIPLTVKQNKSSQSVVISIAIDGGESASPEGEEFLRSVIVNSFARNIQSEITAMKIRGEFTAATQLKAWTDFYCSYITVECIKNDVPRAMDAIFSAIIYGEMKPVTADKLVREQKNLWKNKFLSASNQMEYNALKYLYSGTKYEVFFSQENEALRNTDMNSILAAYTELLNSDLYSIVFSGDISLEEASASAEQNFALLQSHDLSEKKNIGDYYAEYNPKERIVVPNFRNRTRRVQLSHIYSTDKTPDMARGIPILVPTKEFTDPCQYFFAAPYGITAEATRKQNIYNAILYELCLRCNELDGNENFSIREASMFFPVGAIKSSGTTRISIFNSIYKKSLSELRKDLESPEKKETVSKRIRNLWIQKNLSGTQSNEGTAALIQQSILQGNKLLYLENYAAMENISAEEILSVIKEYFTETPPMKVTSVDSKN